MRKTHRFSGIKFLTGMAATLLLLPVLVANAQQVIVQDSPGTNAEKQQPRTTTPGGVQVTPVTSDVDVVEGSLPLRPWSTAGSTGQHDEDSASLVRYNSFGVNIATGQTGSVHVRYNITAVEGVTSFCPATSSVVRTRFRNSDNGGVTARLTYEIHTSSIASGGNTILYTFDSNGKGGGQAFKTVTEFPAIDFNFTTNMYWIEATLFRSVASELTDLGTIQVWESSGTACP